jgi:hypothetical protein
LGSYLGALLEMLCCQKIAAIVENGVVRFGAVLVAVYMDEFDVQIQGFERCQDSHFDVGF